MIALAVLDFFWHPLGACSGTHAQVVACRSYNWWSGSESDAQSALPYLAVIFAVYHWYRRHECSVARCHWPSLSHPTAAGDYVCRRHHPKHNTLTAGDVAKRHEAAVHGGLVPRPSYAAGRAGTLRRTTSEEDP